MAKYTQDASFSTKAIHDGNDPDQWKCRAVVPLISLSTTFKQSAPGVHSGFEYARSGNPTRNCLETCLASLEQAKHALVFSSGLGANTAICHLLESGDHIVAMDDLYGGTNRYFQKVLSPSYGVGVTFVDMSADDKSAFIAALKPSTKMVWIETPTNPTLKLVDIEAIAKIAHEKNPEMIVCVDNTFASPYFQKPLLLGADLVVHSLTKYINGHSDVVMGAAMTNNDQMHEKLRFLQNAIGIVPSPFDCYLVCRSVRTLALRMKEHEKSATIVAEFLSKHPLIEKVLYPGLPSHPQHELAKKQMLGNSGMIGAYLKGGKLEAEKFLQSLKLFTLAESLGGFESLVESPSLMTHLSVPEDMRRELGISDSFIRFSVGLEDVNDLLKDIDEALKKACS
ncbi:unnamed protein product [Notodromas monacha]|uniref:cystathionine gamma-lyase n=1 Tax=Notodromas monacha TaxID=399045 RepID=A0A7R9G845_9CRUS|nr:unnamed protein product [Notodromas monacha]CAG0912741.1 unnamed protein product [Notodromas monacha]